MIFAQALAFAQWQGGASLQAERGALSPLWLLFPEDSRAQSLLCWVFGPWDGGLTSTQPLLVLVDPRNP